MAINVSLLVSAEMLQDYLVDKTSGLPLAEGVITLYQDKSRTTLKNWYYQTGTYPTYSYIVLPNPLTLSAVGTITDGNGNDVIPFFYPYDEITSDPQAYYITVDDSNSTRQFTRSNFPFVPPSETPIANTNPTLQNLIINNTFWRNNGGFNQTNFSDNATSFTLNGSTIYYLSICGSQHDGYGEMQDIQYIKDKKDGTETISFSKFIPSFDDNILTNDVTPEFYINVNCTAAGSETIKYFQFPIQLHVNNLSGYTNASASIWAQNVSGNNNSITLKLFQYLGQGVTSASAKTLITIPATTTWTKYPVNFAFDSSQSLTLSATGDDAWYLQVGFQTGTTCNINIAKPSVYLSQTQPTDEFQNYDVIESIINSPRTGEIKTTLYNNNIFGWVPMNDGTIGSASSGATARANIDTWPLFNLMWILFNKFNNATSNILAQMYDSGGSSAAYGASAYADFIANKRLALTKMMGRVIMGTVNPNEVIIPQFRDAASGSNSGGNLLITTSNVTSFYNGMPIIFKATGGGSLPDAIDETHVYFVSNINPASHVFNLSTSFSNAIAGTLIAYGSTDGTTFDAIGIISGTWAGEYQHVQLESELAAHLHTIQGAIQNYCAGGASSTYNTTGGAGDSNTSSVGSSSPFNITQDFTAMNIYIKL